MFASIRAGLVVLSAASLGTLSGCALQARSDVDTKASLAVCHNYSFGDAARNRLEPTVAFANPLNEKRLREAIAANLVAHGLQPAAEGVAADCTVGYAIGSRLAIEPASPRFGWGIGLGMGHHGGVGGSVAWNSGPYDYREGRVAVDLYNAHSNEALWHAYVDEDVTQLTGDEAEKRINAAVAAIFAKFPGVAH
jgi:hypothetical protein